MKEQREEELARKVVTELQRQGFSIYEEVQLGQGAKRADIVAVRGAMLMVVECKVGFSMKLIDQCVGWVGSANVVIAACGFTRLGIAAERFLKWQGIGLWSVGFQEINEKISPRILRRADTARLRKSLRPEMQSGEYAKAGTQGGHWTPFQGTCAHLRRIVKEQPGIQLRVALKQFEHHYSTSKSAMSAIPALIRNGAIEGLRCEGKPLCLFVAAPEVTRSCDAVPV